MTITIPNQNPGLRGQPAGTTAICTVGKEGVGLTYRGYPIEELAAKVSFEEVAYLLLYGSLPKQTSEEQPRPAGTVKGRARKHSGKSSSHGCLAHGLVAVGGA
jgi:citrate synthase